MTNVQIITLIVASVILIISGISLYVYYKKKKTATEKPTLVNGRKLLEALGGSENILNTSLENKRLKIKLDNPKLVSQALLKSMEISGFLTGKELKLLIKENPIEVKNDLDKIRNEERR